VNWVIQTLIAFDQLINALLSGFADETLSSRAHRMSVKRHRYWWWVSAFIDALFFWQQNHCMRAYENEKRRMQLPPELRG
jgi:hypothetical protein